jgi:hypothetical protein
MYALRLERLVVHEIRRDDESYLSHIDSIDLQQNGFSVVIRQHADLNLLITRLSADKTLVCQRLLWIRFACTTVMVSTCQF